jgi:hypothetical protein
MRERAKFIEKNVAEKSQKRRRKEQGNVLVWGKQRNVCREKSGINLVLYSDMHLIKTWLRCDSSEHSVYCCTVPDY